MWKLPLPGKPRLGRCHFHLTIPFIAVSGMLVLFEKNYPLSGRWVVKRDTKRGGSRGKSRTALQTCSRASSRRIYRANFSRVSIYTLYIVPTRTDRASAILARCSWPFCGPISQSHSRANITQATVDGSKLSRYMVVYKWRPTRIYPQGGGARRESRQAMRSPTDCKSLANVPTESLRGMPAVQGKQRIPVHLHAHQYRSNVAAATRVQGA